MRVALAQLSAGLDKDRNVAAVADAVRDAAAYRPDLVVLPEAVMYDFGRPDTPLAEVAEPLDGPFVATLADLARESGATVVAGMFERPERAAGTRVHNTLVAVDARGDLVAAYRKLHLYDAFGNRESDRLLAGTDEAPTFRLGGHRVGLQTCYDLRFPELTRRLATAGADVVACPAAWVRGPLKEEHWLTLVRARAIENTCYVAAAAQCGPTYCGRSLLVDPMGVAVTALGEEPGVAVGDVRSARLAAVRRRNPMLAHRRFTVSGPHPAPDPADPAAAPDPATAPDPAADPQDAAAVGRPIGDTS